MPGLGHTNNLRRRSPRPGDRWYLDEVFLKINGRLHYLWRAVDQDGDVLDILVQSRRDKNAAKKFFRKLLKGLRYAPRDDHRQAEKLRCGESRSAPLCRALPAEVSKQSGREFTSAHQIAGAYDETVQISRTRAAFSLCLRNHFLALSSGETSVSSEPLPRADEIEICLLGRSDLRLTSHELMSETAIQLG
jgi:hypothetical protein